MPLRAPVKTAPARTDAKLMWNNAEDARTFPIILHVRRGWIGPHMLAGTDATTIKTITTISAHAFMMLDIRRGNRM